MSIQPQNARPVDICAAALRGAVLRADFEVGERLPPERILVERYNVSRPTLRSALDRLVGDGLLSVRQGRGYEVRDFRHSAGPSLVAGLLDPESRVGPGPVNTLTEVLDIRRALAEVLFKQLLARRKDSDFPAALHNVDRAVEAFAGGIERGEGGSRMAELDVQVIRTLVGAAKSTVLGLFLNPIHGLLLESADLRAAVYHAPLSNLTAYREVLTWLRRSVDEDHLDPGGVVESLAGLLKARDAASVACFRERASLSNTDSGT